MIWNVLQCLKYIWCIRSDKSGFQKRTLELQYLVYFRSFLEVSLNFSVSPFPCFFLFFCCALKTLAKLTDGAGVSKDPQSMGWKYYRIFFFTSDGPNSSIFLLFFFVNIAENSKKWLQICNILCHFGGRVALLQSLRSFGAPCIL